MVQFTSLEAMEPLRRLLTDFKSYSGRTPNRIELRKGRNLIQTEGFEGWTMLHYAASESGYKLMLVYILWRISSGKENIDINAQNHLGDTALHVAADDNSYLVPLLIEAGAKVDVRNKLGKTPLHILASGAKPRAAAISVLVKNGASLDHPRDNEEMTPLHSAILAGNVDCIDTMVDLGADIEAPGNFGNRPLHIAAQSGQSTEVIRRLLDQGADPNARNDIGDLPIHFAKSVSVLEALLSAQDSDIDVLDGKGETCLALACVRDDVEMVVRLVILGASPHLQDHEGNTPAHFAASLDVLKRLLLSKVDPRVENYLGRTAFHATAASGNKDMEFLEALLEHGYDVDAKDNDGLTPFDYASRRWRERMRQNKKKESRTINVVVQMDQFPSFSKGDCDFSGNTICPVRGWWSWTEAKTWMTGFTASLEESRAQRKPQISRNIPVIVASIRNLRGVYAKHIIAKNARIEDILFGGDLMGEDTSFMGPFLQDCHDRVMEWLSICFATLSLMDRFSWAAYEELVAQCVESLMATRRTCRSFTGKAALSTGEAFIISEYLKQQAKIEKLQFALECLFK